MVGHQPHPRRPAPREPPTGSLHPPAMLRPSPAGPHRAKPQEGPVKKIIKYNKWEAVK
jgi:hypothetical protein